MADVLIDFKVDYSQLTGAVEQLEQAGVVEKGMSDNIKKANAAFKEQGNAVKGPITSIDQLDKRTKKFLQDFVTGIQEGMTEELAKAGMRIGDLEKALASAGKTGGKAVGSLRQELKQLTQQIAQAKANGGPIDEGMIKRAGELKDAISDTNQIIKDAGSDTRGFDEIVGSLSAVAGAFSAVQGATALFADDSEDLQKALLKVNSAMAIAQGLQQVGNALQREGAITLALLNAQERINVIQTQLQTAAESKNIIVRYAAIAAQRALNLVMAANPIGLILTLLAAVATALFIYTQRTNEAASATGKYAGLVERLNEGLAKKADIINRNSRRETIDLQKAGAEQSKILQVQLDNINQRIEAGETEIKLAQKVLAQTTFAGEERQKAEDSLTKAVEDNRNLRLDAQEKELEITKAQEAERKKAQDDTKKSEQDTMQAKKERIADSIALLKLEQLSYDESTTHYRVLQQAIINLQGEYDALGQSAAQAAFIQAKAAKEAQDIDLSSKVSSELAKVQVQTIDTTKAVKGLNVELLKINNGGAATAAGGGYAGFLKKLEDVNKGLSAINDVANKFNEISRQRKENLDRAFEAEQKNLDALLKSGAITEKEAVARQDRLDKKKQVAEVKAAKQEKQLAILAAIINTAQAVTKALTAGPVIGPILAAATAALGAVQIGLIKSQPLPKFATGKQQGSHEGLGWVGDAGAELVQQGGRMWVANKPQIVYLGRQDKVFTAAETNRVLPGVNKRAMNAQASQLGFDYARLAGMMPGASNTSVNIDKNFIKESVRDGLMTVNYYSRRYRK